MIKTKRQPGVILNKVPAKRERKESESSESESESDLLSRIFGKPEKLSEQATLKNIDEPLVNLDDTNNAEEPDEKPKKSEFVWQDDDDDTNKQQSAREKFAELSGGWLKLKKVDAEEDPFGGKIFQDDTRILPEKEIDIEECGTIGIRGGGKIGAFEFHPAAPAAMVAQQDMLTMFQIDGRQNPKLQSIRLDKFPIKCAKIISKQEILATSDFPWFYSYDIEYGTIKRFPHIRGAQMRHLRGFYAAYGSKFLAFPDNGGKIAIVSAGSKELVDVMQSATNSAIDCHFSTCGTKLWSLAENGEVMLFDLRQMRPVNVFNDMSGATSLGINKKESLFCVGSNSGLINVYDGECQIKDDAQPVKTIKNLRAPVTMQKFNNNGELALFASELLAGQTKLYHCPSHRIV